MQDASLERMQQIERRLTSLITLLVRAGFIEQEELDATEKDLARAAQLLEDGPEPVQKQAPQDSSPKCTVCGQDATRIIFSNAGSWKICQRPECLDGLCSKYSEADSRLTWLSRPLPKKN